MTGKRNAIGRRLNYPASAKPVPLPGAHMKERESYRNGISLHTHMIACTRFTFWYVFGLPQIIKSAYHKMRYNCCNHNQHFVNWVTP